jgi:hypothetical protein
VQQFVGRPVSIIIFCALIVVLAFALSYLKPDPKVVEISSSALTAVGMYACMSFGWQRITSRGQTSSRAPGR